MHRDAYIYWHVFRWHRKQNIFISRHIAFLENCYTNVSKDITQINNLIQKGITRKKNQNHILAVSKILRFLEYKPIGVLCNKLSTTIK